MNFLSGLEKFGLSASDDMTNDLFDDGTKKKTDKDGEEQEAEAVPTEPDFLLQKGVRCAICDKTFLMLQVKSGRVKRLDSDEDLRPRYQYIDTLKYSLISCPYCGYTAFTRTADVLTSVQRKLVKEQICDKFKGGQDLELPDFYTYDEALERYKLALFTAIAKKDKNSEKAYLLLNMSWLLRGKIEKMKEFTPEDVEGIKKAQEEEAGLYSQAYDGLMKAIQTESFPMCGMDESTMMLLLAVMSYKHGKIDVASRFVSQLLTSKVANQRMKNRALELKEKIVAEIKKNKK